MMIEKTNRNHVSSFLEKQQVKNAAAISNPLQEDNAKKGASPAYILELEGKYKSEDKTEPIHKKDAVTKNVTDDALETFKEKFLENIKNNNLIMPDELISEPILKCLTSGDELVTAKFHAIRGMVEGNLAPNQTDEFLAFWDKYANAKKNISEGGKDTVLEYNLMFAGTAAYANDKMAESWLSYYKESGDFTEERYNNVKQYAADLQKKAGVFVSAEFQREDLSGNDIKYSYMGALCTIGVEQLEFMAKHKEAEDIWINVAKGKYQNKGELYQALRGGGYDNAAEEYLRRSSNQEGQFVEKKFEEEDGALWDVTVGFKSNGPADKQAFQELKNKYFGKEDVHVTYTSEQLHNAYEQGKKEARIINRPPSMQINGNEDKNTGIDNRQRIESLKKQLKELNKQIREIKSMALPEDTKNEMTKKFEQQIQTVQIQINDTLESMSKEER